MRSPLTPLRLRQEKLEARRLLATDLGQIAGVVTNYLTGDGASTAAAAGVSVELFLDDGDNGFDPVSGGGGDASQGTTTTDAAGAYSFDNLTAGNYFVRITPPSGQQTLSGGDVSSLIETTAAEAMGSTNITIDDFTAAQDITATSPGTPTNSATVDGVGIEGGEQDLFVEVTNGAGDVRGRSGFNNGSATVLSLSSDSGVNGRLIASWDGDDNDAVNLSQGLGADLLQSGVNSAFALNIAANEAVGTLILRAHNGAGNTSTATIELNNLDGGADNGTADDVDTDGIINGTAAEQISVAFSDFVTTGGSGVGDFSSVTALELEIDFSQPGENGLDVQVEVLGVVGFTTETQDFTVVNELTLGDRVFLDLDNDGLFEVGESGIAGVALTLFEDTDSDGDYLDEIALANATTDAQGLYGFTGLAPADYIVRVDQTNFNGGQPLEGLATSTGNDPAPDPDGDADNDDNGTLQADGSVTSATVTLVGDGEPTTDGDTDNNTNLSVDFGFFGFNLVVDKQVDQSAAAPNDTLVYTVTVTNDGPSTASGVTFNDTLPAGVTYASGLTSVTGESVNGSAGSSTVTSTIGTLVSGASATITINATVDATTLGTIVNSATASAANEADTSDNTDTATTTVSPVVDVAITKVDDDNNQTLSPGDDLQYTLTVTNNGPSTATGVTVTDVLPTGLTFDSVGSTSPDSTAAVSGGTQLTYNLNSLASGADQTIVINADISSTFTGTLLNEAEVSANETESVTSNNQASASSTVAVTPASISGSVYVDADNDGQFDPGETPIAGVVVTLTGTDFNGSSVSLATATNSLGGYSFTGLNPGTYTVTETQPTFFGDGLDSAAFPGAVATNDQISSIVLTPGEDATANNFGELPPTLSKRRFLASNLDTVFTD